MQKRKPGQPHKGWKASARQARRPTPIKIAQAIFRDWCARHGAVVDVEMGASLVGMIAFAIEAERGCQ